MVEELLRDSSQRRWESPLAFPGYCGGRLDLHGPDHASALQDMAGGGHPERPFTLHLQLQRDRAEESFMGTARLQAPLRLQGLDTLAWTWRPSPGCRTHLALDRHRSAHATGHVVNAANTIGASAALNLRSTNTDGPFAFPELPSLEGWRCQAAATCPGDRTAALALALEAHYDANAPPSVSTATGTATARVEEPWQPDRLHAALTYSRGYHTHLGLRAEVWPTAAKPTLAMAHSHNVRVANRLVSLQVRAQCQMDSAMPWKASLFAHSAARIRALPYTYWRSTAAGILLSGDRNHSTPVVGLAGSVQASRDLALQGQWSSLGDLSAGLTHRVALDNLATEVGFVVGHRPDGLFCAFRFLVHI